MVKQLNVNLIGGVAGRRATSNPKGVVIHNDAGSLSAEQYVYDFLPNHNLQAGFAHYYCDRNTVARVENTYNMAWHTASSEGNTWYVGYEVVQSMSATDKEFLANEQATFKQVAEDLQFWGLPANRQTVRLHREFVATACPHRSWQLHGQSVNAVKDYFIEQIKLYMNGTPTSVEVPRDEIEIKYVPNYGVLTFNRAGQSYLDSNLIFKHGTRWKSSGIELINNRPMYQVSLNMYVPKEFTNQAGLVEINAISGIDAVNSKGVKQAGSYKTFKDHTKWKTNDNSAKVIKGRLYFQVSTDQWIDAYYTMAGGNK